MEGKICTKCNEYKLKSEYHKQSGKPMDINPQCIECRKSGKRLNYQNNKEKYKEAYQKFIERNPTYRKEYRKKNIKNISNY